MQEQDLEPIVTIGIPTKNRASCLDKVLISILKLDYPRGKMRLVFVDDFSTDGTEQIIRRFIDEYEKHYEKALIFRLKSNIPKARNVCVDNSSGPYILFVDSDVIVDPQVIRHSLQLFQSDPATAIVWQWYLPDKLSLIEDMYYHIGSVKPHSTLGCGMGCTMIKIAALRDVGCFDERFSVCEDMHLAVRLTKHKYKVTMDPTITCKHLKTRKESFPRLMRSFFGPVALYNYLILADQKPMRYLRRIAFYTVFLAGLLSFPFAPYPWKLIPLLILLVGYAYHSNSLRGLKRFTYPFVFLFLGMILTLGVYFEFLKRLGFRVGRSISHMNHSAWSKRLALDKAYTK